VASTVLRRQGLVPATRYRSLIKEPDPVPLLKAVCRRDGPIRLFVYYRANSSPSLKGGASLAPIKETYP
jgi:hypothetical protein